MAIKVIYLPYRSCRARDKLHQALHLRRKFKSKHIHTHTHSFTHPPSLSLSGFDVDLKTKSSPSARSQHFLSQFRWIISNCANPTFVLHAPRANKTPANSVSPDRYMDEKFRRGCFIMPNLAQTFANQSTTTDVWRIWSSSTEEPHQLLLLFVGWLAGWHTPLYTKTGRHPSRWATHIVWEPTSRKYCAATIGEEIYSTL